MTGTTPPGTDSEEQAAHWVREMFARVAPRYDVANHLLSFNSDRYWRRCTVKRVREILSRPDARVLDLCCGTGDLAIALRRAGKAPVLGADFCHPMLVAAQQKAPELRLFEADALGLPLATRSLDLVTCAFGFRNLANYEAGLHELHRVLRPGGTLALLEFSHPPQPWFGRLYEFYSRYVLPRVGGWVSGVPGAYRYLPESVVKFPEPDELAVHMRTAGFVNVRFERFTFGIVALHLGVAG
jgi:demethylmenaquinone methyltransferase/2-methoxy-6-polyprenyl-1,4-benzoquinol methylase